MKHFKLHPSHEWRFENKAAIWCHKNLGGHGLLHADNGTFAYTDRRWINRGGVFYFRTEADAVLFKLAMHG